MHRIGVLCAVRDDRVCRRVMMEMDDGEQYSFLIAASGTQALHAGRKFRPDILLADAVLSGIDGPALADALRGELGAAHLRVIGGAWTPFARQAFVRRGASRVLSVPWVYEEVRQAIQDAAGDIKRRIDWDALKVQLDLACGHLDRFGMKSALRGYDYLAHAAALTAMDESRLSAIGEQIYAPVAGKFAATPQNVERLIRHAVESTMDSAGAEELYAFFGNTIDPMRGKPTNAQMIGLLAQKVRL